MGHLICVRTSYTLSRFIWISQHLFKEDIHHYYYYFNFNKIITNTMNYILITKVQTVQM